MIIINCEVNKPYPEIKVECQNKEYASILLKSYSGMVSESTAIFQYTYQHISKYNDSEFSKTLENISIVEMKHLEMLGKTIKLLGVEPVFKFNDKMNNYLTYFSSSFVNYTTNIIDMLNSNIQSEYAAINEYMNAINSIADKYIKELLYRIIEDEKKHIECFNILLNRYSHQ